MDPGPGAAVTGHIDQMFESLIVMIQNQTMQSSASDERERLLQVFNLLNLIHETFNQRLLRHITETGRKINSHAPIHRLSDELLVQIFALALNSIPIQTASNPHFIVVIGLVSKKWSRIVFETPSLWVHISSRFSDRQNTAAIIKSNGYPLRVSCFDVDFKNRSRVPFNKYANKEAFRWQSVAVSVGDNKGSTLALLRSFVSLSVPRLEELKIDCSELEGFEGESIDVFDEGAERLRHVDLLNFPIPLSSQLLSRLETLKLYGLDIWPGTCTDDILDILRRCPKLRVFKFDYSDLEGIRVSGTTPPEAEAVLLPFLTSLDLSFESTEVFRQIVASIRIPACTQFYLTCYDRTGNVFTGETSHLTALLLRVIQHLPKISLSLEASGLTLTEPRDRINKAIKIFMYHSSPWEVLASLIEQAERSVPWPPIEAQISCGRSLPFHEVADVIRKIPSITKLELTGDSHDYITQLSHPVLDNGIYAWVLPNLEELSLNKYSKNVLQPLADLPGKRRQAPDMDRGDGVRLGLPTELKRIHVRKP
ncbi:hypothetical protein FRB95_011620 [Tulasnella sp. JGI-2019a]|nr:hypothetical protein FRB95_011620 [Tulasnella sp. JGI-2019a]